MFPEIRSEDGKIDFDRLKMLLGEIVDVGKERYSMNWPGKAECFKTIQMPSIVSSFHVRMKALISTQPRM